MRGINSFEKIGLLLFDQIFEVADIFGLLNFDNEPALRVITQNKAVELEELTRSEMLIGAIRRDDQVDGMIVAYIELLSKREWKWNGTAKTCDFSNAFYPSMLSGSFKRRGSLGYYDVLERQETGKRCTHRPKLDLRFDRFEFEPLQEFHNKLAPAFL